MYIQFKVSSLGRGAIPHRQYSLRRKGESNPLPDRVKFPNRRYSPDGKRITKRKN